MIKRVALDKLPVPPEVRSQIAGMANVDGCLTKAGSRTLVYGPGCDNTTLHDAQLAFPNATHVWVRADALRAVANISKVEEAIELMATGLTANAAAQKAGVNSSAVYRALAVRKGRACCPTCGQLLPR